MPRSKKVSPPKINKVALLNRLVEKPSQGIREWSMREFAILKRLEEVYPLEFLNIIDFGKKLPSLAVLSSEWGKTELSRKFHAYNYVAPQEQQIILAPNKIGEDSRVEKKKTLRDLL